MICNILANNYYFYSHVERSSKRDAKQLNLILENQINYCKMNNVEVNSCNNLLINTINSFSKNAYYNDTIVIDGQDLQKESLSDKVVKSDIKVDLLKDFILNMIKDEDEKRIIRGGLWWVIISVTDDGYYFLNWFSLVE